MAQENLGSLVDEMIKLAVKNPKVLNPEYKGKDAVAYDTLMGQLNLLQQDYDALQSRVFILEKNNKKEHPQQREKESYHRHQKDVKSNDHTIWSNPKSGEK